ncbi:uncharacterized protein LOC103791995 [Callithrix jacchus]|uniref:growth-regulated alpha protein-like n=1 Tax=Callithrix jacchus TaxID=9483 RepID=UPI00159DD193|nr:growth-regulated alpha protein-like [Callithrix jacchus]
MKRVRRSREAREPGLQAPPRLLSRSWHNRLTSLPSPTARAAPPAAPGAPRLLRAALLLLLLVAAGQRAAGESVVNELSCQCLQILQRIHRQEHVKCEQVPRIPLRPNRRHLSPAAPSRCQRWGLRPSGRPTLCGTRPPVSRDPLLSAEPHSRMSRKLV